VGRNPNRKPSTLNPKPRVATHPSAARRRTTQRPAGHATRRCRRGSPCLPLSLSALVGSDPRVMTQGTRCTFAFGCKKGKRSPRHAPNNYICFLWVQMEAFQAFLSLADVSNAQTASRVGLPCGTWCARRLCRADCGIQYRSG
jgi:hypothetical protein